MDFNLCAFTVLQICKNKCYRNASINKILPHILKFIMTWPGNAEIMATEF